MERYLISACLVGTNCKYNGGNNFNQKIVDIYNKTDSILICPESMGGLSIPRHPCEIQSNWKIISDEGVDCTVQYNLGAQKALEIARKENIKKAILKANSPSCGVHHIYDGSFSHKVIEGKGVTAKLLSKNGIELFDEEDF